MASKAEIKHKKQKAKLEKAPDSELTVVPYVQKPTEKQIWFEKSQRAGFNCALKNSVLMFGVSTIDQKKKVLEFLGVSYKEENSQIETDPKTLPPFSFGFCSVSQLPHVDQQTIGNVKEEEE